MKEVKKITQKVLVLGWDMLLFTWQVIQRVILPSRRRKGNVLSSLLTFFVGLLERVVSFEKSILQRPVIFTHKYVKQGLVIAVGFLFLLSSVEWTIGPSTDIPLKASPQVATCVQVDTSVQAATVRRRDFSVALPPSAGSACHSYTPLLDLTGPPTRGKRWLRLRVFRI